MNLGRCSIISILQYILPLYIYVTQQHKTITYSCSHLAGVCVLLSLDFGLKRPVVCTIASETFISSTSWSLGEAKCVRLRGRGEGVKALSRSSLGM